MPTVFIDLLIKAGRAALVEKIFNAPAYRQAIAVRLRPVVLYDVRSFHFFLLV